MTRRARRNHTGIEGEGGAARARADHARSERLLADSGLDWTALRPMLLDDAPSKQPAEPMRQGDRLLAKVSRESVARTIVQMLGDRSTFGRAIPLCRGRDNALDPGVRAARRPRR